MLISAKIPNSSFYLEELLHGNPGNTQWNLNITNEKNEPVSMKVIINKETGTDLQFNILIINSGLVREINTEQVVFTDANYKAVKNLYKEVHQPTPQPNQYQAPKLQQAHVRDFKLTEETLRMGKERFAVYQDILHSGIKC